MEMRQPDLRTEGMKQRESTKRSARGTKAKDKDDGATITLEPVKKALRDLGHLATKAAEANEKLKDAVKAVAEKSGLNASVVKRLVKAHSGNRSHFDDEKRKVQQLGIAFEDIEYEGEITKETKPN